MKIGIFSDTHFGFDENGEREKECFENARAAFEICFREKVDAVVLAGDLFDEALPSPETLSGSFDVFFTALKQPKSAVKVTVFGKGMQGVFDFSGIPVIAIHGNHDCRSIGKTNILEVFSKSGILAYLFPGKALLEKNGEKVWVHGFSAVPEKKARDVLKLWNPVPEKGASNVLVMHQSFQEFLPFADDMIASLSFDDLPQGFDLVVNGHLHWTDTQKIGSGLFVLAGSTITTQMKKLEAERKKGVFVFDSQKKSIGFFGLPSQRRLFYHRIKFENATAAHVMEKAKEAIEKSISENNSALSPLVRLKLEGNLALGASSLDINFKELLEETKGKAIVSLSKNFFSNSFKKKISDLRSLQKSRQSISRIGFEFLEKNLAETDFNGFFDAREVFDLLSENRLEEAVQRIQSKSK